jgi:hypothetical protein
MELLFSIFGRHLTSMNIPPRNKKGRYYTHMKLVQFTLETQKNPNLIIFVENKICEDFIFVLQTI